MEIVSIPCPQCGHQLRLRDRGLLGQAARCPECNHKFLLEERDGPRRPDIVLSGRETIAPGELAESLAEPSRGREPGVKEFGRYQLLHELGQGAMGTVYLARDAQLGRQVALKIPKFGDHDSSELLERFYREARSAATLRHPNICPVYDVGEVDGMHYLAMAYIEGRTLSSYVSPKKLQPEHEVVGIVRKLASALNHAHKQGIVHRDLKPSNIMIDQRNEPIVMDFGLALQLDAGNDRLTQTGTMLGTPAYMPPEQVRAEWDKVGPHSDIYSLGVILFELLTGDIPFDGATGVVMALVLTQEPPKPSRFRSDLDPRLEAICLQMMAKEIGNRYASMREVDAALAGFLKSPRQKTAKQKAAEAASAAAPPSVISDSISQPRETARPSRRTDVEIVSDVVPQGQEEPRLTKKVLRNRLASGTQLTTPGGESLSQENVEPFRWQWLIAGAVGFFFTIGLTWGVSSYFSNNDDSPTANTQTESVAISPPGIALTNDATNAIDNSDRVATVAVPNHIEKEVIPQTPGIKVVAQPAGQPDLLAVEDLIADPGRGIIPFETVPVVAGGGSARASGTSAKGVHFVAVRGIVPLYRQIEQVADALNLVHKEASKDVVYWDFRLERRIQSANDVQDFGKWEQVDVRTALQVLRDSASWDAELIELSLTDPVLTMSLPSRVLYEWRKSEVGHPKVESYLLTPSQRERQMDIYESYLDQQVKETSIGHEQQRKGLSALQRGGRDFGRVIGIGPDGGMRSQSTQNLVNRIAQGVDSGNAERVKQELLAQLMKNKTAAGRLLLFRYLDFDVTPGMTYQYRVQLLMANPNYEKPQHLVLDPEITRERFLSTPFSQPTGEVTVPHDVNFYVTKVDDGNWWNPRSATFAVYQWSEKYGSTIHKNLKVQFGSFVGDRTTTNVIDVPHKMYLEDQEVDFNSNDVLIDVVDAPASINVEEHQDLAGLPRDVLRRGLGVSEQALLVTESGKLVAYDPVSMFNSYRETKDKKALEDRELAPIKERGAARAAAGLEAFEDEFRAAGPSVRKRRVNVSNRRRRRKGGLRRGTATMPGSSVAP